MQCAMSKAPQSKFSLSVCYLKDKLYHKTWDSNAPPNFQKEFDISGQLVIVTGSNTGIGRETALHLAKRGAHVIIACRDLRKGQSAKEYITGQYKDANIDVMQLDLGDLSSVRSFVTAFQEKYDKLDILINNAGVFSTGSERQTTVDGFELHIGINHLGPFLLTILLLPLLRKATPGPAKIICVSSSNMTISRLRIDDLMMEKEYRPGSDGSEPYNVSKLASALCIRILASKLEASQETIRIYQLCPGFVKTEVFRNDGIGGFSRFMRQVNLCIIGLTPTNGAESSVYCATDRELGSNPKFGKGEIHRFCKYYEQGTSFLDPKDPIALELYKMSEKLVGLDATTNN